MKVNSAVCERYEIPDNNFKIVFCKSLKILFSKCYESTCHEKTHCDIAMITAA